MEQSVEIFTDVTLPVFRKSESAAGGYSVKILSGFDAVFAAEPVVAQLLQTTGQTQNPLLCLKFFLGRVRLFPRNRPVVILVSSEKGLEGAVYLYEKMICGLPTGYLRGFDHLSGESCVIAPQQLRASLLQIAIHQLFLRSRARIAWATVSDSSLTSSASDFSDGGALHMETDTIIRRHRLKFNESYEGTLSRFGRHTRRNLRYYRRRAEKELKVSFQPELTMEESEQALRQLSVDSFQPFSKSSGEWQLMDSLLRTQPGYFAMGMRAGDNWVSYLVGVRAKDLSYVVLQMNHSGFARYSLSTVMRSYFFEHEIKRGQVEAKFVNGTCALFQRCCEMDTCLTVSARRGLAALAITNWIAPRYNAPDHALNMKRWGRRPRPIAT